MAKIRGKECSVITAFHPSVFAKGISDGRLEGPEAVKQAALLEFCFLQAVNITTGTKIIGPGVEELRGLALGGARQHLATG